MCWTLFRDKPDPGDVVDFGQCCSRTNVVSLGRSVRSVLTIRPLFETIIWHLSSNPDSSIHAVELTVVSESLSLSS